MASPLEGIILLLLGLHVLSNAIEEEEHADWDEEVDDGPDEEALDKVDCWDHCDHSVELLWADEECCLL